MQGTLQNFAMRGTAALEVLTGTSAPTTNTVGKVTQFYLDTSYPALYQCTAVSSGTYTWSYIGAQLETGSYVGTGTYGSENPNSLTPDFTPYLIFIEGTTSGTDDWALFICNGLTSSYAAYKWIYNGLLDSHDYAKQDGNTVYWYTTQTNAYYQLNAAVTYYYTIIGK